MRRRHHRIAKLEFRERGPIWLCTKSDHKLLLRHVTRLHLPAGRMLMRQGECRGQFVVLVKGSAVVMRDGVVCEHLGPGGHVGGLTALYGIPHPTDVVNTIPVDVDVIDGREFRTVLSQLGMLNARIRDEIDRQRRDWCVPSDRADIATGARAASAVV
jgi:CRP-like cAMP-binding protein